MTQAKFPMMLDEERAKYVTREIAYEQEIKSMRQKLATMTAERDAYMRDYGEEQDRKREVAQQLAIRDAEVARLQNKLGQRFSDYNTFEQMRANEFRLGRQSRDAEIAELKEKLKVATEPKG